MKWIAPIYDRTALDVANRTSKAFFNVADWIRINGNTQQINAIVNVMLGFNIPFTVLTPPTIPSIPSVDEINQFIANIDRLQAAAYLPDGTGIIALKHDYLPGNGQLSPNYAAVNDWERDIDILRSAVLSSADYRISCGVSAAGQPRFWQCGFRQYIYVPTVTSPVRHGRSGVASSGPGLTRQNLFRRYA